MNGLHHLPAVLQMRRQHGIGPRTCDHLANSQFGGRARWRIVPQPQPRRGKAVEGETAHPFGDHHHEPRQPSHLRAARGGPPPGAPAPGPRLAVRRTGRGLRRGTRADAAGDRGAVLPRQAAARHRQRPARDHRRYGPGRRRGDLALGEDPRRRGGAAPQRPGGDLAGGRPRGLPPLPDEQRREPRQAVSGLRPVRHRHRRQLRLPDDQAGALSGPHAAHPLQDQPRRHSAPDHPVLREGTPAERAGRTSSPAR